MIERSNETVLAEPVVRNSFLPFALPDLDETELNEIKEALESGWITTGPKVKQFEKEFAEAVGAKHAVAVNSCTAAMHLALEAIGVKRGDEVITTPYTFAATAEVIRYFDAKPVLVDVLPETLNLNPSLIEGAITPRTKAIIPVHIAGVPAAMDAIHAVARKHGVAVIEDAAHAFPTKYKGRMVGSLGSEFTCFSFYATKTLTTGEGGMICTDNDAYADRCRIMALHGISRDAWKRYTAEGSWFYEITAPGYKYNMTDVAAAMGLAQLRKAERMLRRRTEIAERYNNAFREIPSLQIPEDRNQKSEIVPLERDFGGVPRRSGISAAWVPPQEAASRGQKVEINQKSAVDDNVGTGGSHSWHLYMLRLNVDESPEGVRVQGSERMVNGQRSIVNCQQGLSIDRAKFIEELKARNIGASVHFIPLHIHPYYRETYGYTPEDFPVAYREYMREISLPIYSKMTDQDVQDVIDAVLDIVEKNGH